MVSPVVVTSADYHAYAPPEAKLGGIFCRRCPVDDEARAGKRLDDSGTAVSDRLEPTKGNGWCSNEPKRS